MNSFSTLKKRALMLTLVLTLVLSVCSSLCSCVQISSATLSEIEGTYELTGYSGKEDLLTSRNIALKIVIRADGTGYYACTKDGAEPYISELKCEFEPDTENPGKYSYVTLTFSGGGTKHRLAIDSKNKNLNSMTPVWTGSLLNGDLTVDHYINVDFTMVSRSTDISSLREAFPNAPFYPFGSLDCGGTYRLEADANEGLSDRFVYYYVRFDPRDDTGEAWYMLRNDGKAVHTEFKLTIVNAASGFFLAFDDTSVEWDPEPFPEVIRHTSAGGSIVLTYCGDLSDEEIASEISSALGGQD